MERRGGGGRTDGAGEGGIGGSNEIQICYVVIQYNKSKQANKQASVATAQVIFYVELSELSQRGVGVFVFCSAFSVESQLFGAKEGEYNVGTETDDDVTLPFTPTNPHPGPSIHPSIQERTCLPLHTSPDLT